MGEWPGPAAQGIDLNDVDQRLRDAHVETVAALAPRSASRQEGVDDPVAVEPVLRARTGAVCLGFTTKRSVERIRV